VVHVVHPGVARRGGQDGGGERRLVDAAVTAARHPDPGAARGDDDAHRSTPSSPTRAAGSVPATAAPSAARATLPSAVRGSASTRYQRRGRWAGARVARAT